MLDKNCIQQFTKEIKKIFVKRDIKKNNNRKPKQKQLDTKKKTEKLQQIQIQNKTTDNSFQKKNNKKLF